MRTPKPKVTLVRKQPPRHASELDNRTVLVDGVEVGRVYKVLDNRTKSRYSTRWWINDDFVQWFGPDLQQRFFRPLSELREAVLARALELRAGQ